MSEYKYGVPHVPPLYDTRHEAIGRAAIVGRKKHRGPLYWTQRVVTFQESELP